IGHGATPRSQVPASDPTSTIASALARPELTGSRNGPAGITLPLPNPYSASITTSDRSFATLGFWYPSSSTIAGAPADTAAPPPAARSRAIQHGWRAAINS